MRKHLNTFVCILKFFKSAMLLAFIRIMGRKWARVIEYPCVHGSADMSQQQPCNKGIFKFNFLKLVVYITVLTVSSNAWSLATDNKQPTFIQSDSGSYNRVQGISILKGNVIITQGTTKIYADKVIIYSDHNNKLLRTIAIGIPATYKTIESPSKPVIILTAKQIEYNPVKDLVVLNGHAKVNQGMSSISSSQIVYHIKAQQVDTFSKKGDKTVLYFQPQNFNSSLVKTK